MKRVLFIVLALAAVLLVAGCSLFDKSYYWEYGVGDLSLCFEVKTSDSSVQADLIDDGFIEGTCSSQGYPTAESCSTTATYNGDTIDMAIYFNNNYFDLLDSTGSTLQTYCEDIGYTYNN
jgi:hypothetical protein